MKRSMLTYLLILLVIAIWGYAGYRYLFERPGDTESSQQAYLLPGDATTLPSLPRDTSVLALNYRDPFLSKSGDAAPPRFGSEVPPPAASPPATEPMRSQRPVEAPIISAVDWNVFRYNGLIQKSGTQQHLGILRIRQKSYFVTVGSRAEASEVLRLDADSIRIQVGTEIKTIGRR